jgi:Skp family chaperone for outer membrane proteins
MALARTIRRAGALSRGIVLALVLSVPVAAQEVATPILIIDQDRFFLESAFGKASIARERAAEKALQDENTRIEAELVAEEQALTELRKTLPAAEFSVRAEAFDAKVERIRAEQDSKARGLTDGRDAERQAFLKAAVPVLGELLSERQAIAILDKTTIILSLSAIDVTDEAIAKVDAALAAEKPAPGTP